MKSNTPKRRHLLCYFIIKFLGEYLGPNILVQLKPVLSVFNFYHILFTVARTCCASHID